MTGRRVKVRGGLYAPRVPAGAVYIGRRGPALAGSPYANPYPAREHGRAEALRLYTAWLHRQPDLIARARTELAGKDLACWCDEQLPLGWTGPWCHGDVLLKVLASPA
ncbi:DUF4326 domain-containing protein [Catenuloplanes indicus]|uniref:Glutaminase n=1 Tax=Catenuloplanes indicus TaxID=137267 RepID=A0AAE4AUY4_9ACTN|nr:DUF4326 domain-containing protein [Catenuloplanes indicus]MDQ0363422.1 glutaminase [Catenuloplanes indicus]